MGISREVTVGKMGKRKVKDLAVFGGEPVFAEAHHVGRPNIGDTKALFARLSDILERRWLTNNGPYLTAFEERIAEICHVRHCVAVSNATAGLEIAIHALDLKGEVIIPSFTFVATAHALKWLGVRPVFCDIDPATHNLDPAGVSRLINPRTTGILGVHVWGRACDVERLTEIAKTHQLRLLFDAAHAFGCSHKGTMIGNFGDAEVFSFHATKFFNTLEGGAIVTNDDILADRLRLMRNFGFRGYDNVIDVGTNGKMNEFSAAMGLTGLESLDTFITVNHRNYSEYMTALQGIPGIHLLGYDETEAMNYQYVVLEVDNSLSGITRDQLIEILHAERILARRYFYPGCHRMEPYRSLYGNLGQQLPNTERLTEQVLSLPTGTATEPEDIQTICNIIRFIVTHSDEISDRLPSKSGPTG